MYVCVLSCSIMPDSLGPRPPPQNTAHQAPLSMEFFRQEHWSGLLFPTPVYFPDPGIEPAPPVSSVLACGFFTTESPEKPNQSVSPQERVSIICCLCGSIFHWDLSWWIPLSMVSCKKSIHEFLVLRSRDQQTSVKKEERNIWFEKRKKYIRVW